MRSKSNITTWGALLVFAASSVWLQYCLHFKQDDGYRHVSFLQRDIAEFDASIKQQHFRNNLLKAQVIEITDNPEYIDTTARKMLYMIKPGEFYVLPQ